MPVIPDCVPKFHIRPPSTTNDNGLPTDSISNDIKRLFSLIDDERHITAFKLLTSIRNRIVEFETKYQIIIPTTPANGSNNNKENDSHQGKNGLSSSLKKNNAAAIKSNSNKKLLGVTRRGGGGNASPSPILNTNPIIKKLNKMDKIQFEKSYKEIEHVKNYLQHKHETTEKLENRYRLFQTARKNLNENDDWTFASKHFGITTHYRRENDKSLSIKLEGEMEGVSLFDQICVLKELDLHYIWSPFCTSSLTVADLDKLDLVGWFFVGLPRFGLARDGCFRAIGCDNISEDGSVILAGQGISDLVVHNGIIHPEPNENYLSKDPIIQKLDIPPVPTRRGSGRMTIRRFEALIYIKDATTATTKLVANIDPNISFLPNTVLEFVMKHLAGVIISKLQHAAKKISKDPIHNEHAMLMRNEEYAFYHDWLLPIFEAVCKRSGWEMPEPAAFTLTTEQLQAEQVRRDKNQVSIRRARSENGIVENLSQITQENSEKERALSDGDVPTDLLSDISSNNDTGSVWSRNPLATYLRGREEGVKKRKVAQVAANRRRIEALLVPKDLSYDQEKRLDELKRAKCFRLGLPYEKRHSSSFSIDEDEPFLSNADVTLLDRMPTINEKRITFSQRFTKVLHEQSPKSRFLTISFLIILLFIFLHAEILGIILLHVINVSLLKHFPSIILIQSISSSSWSMTILKDVFIVFYIFLCIIPHFLLCDTALVYAFDALELSSKSGSQVRRYYTDNARLGMACLSGGIALFSIGQSLFRVGVHLIIYYSSQAYHYIFHNMMPKILFAISDKLNVLIPDQMVKLMTWTSWMTATTAYYLSVWASRFTLFLLDVQMNFFVRSHILGRVAELLGTIAGKIAMRAVWRMKTIEVFFNSESSWRYDAFGMARSLFAYTSIFLLAVVMLFTLSARKASFKLLGQENNKTEKQKKFAHAMSSITMDGALSSNQSVIRVQSDVPTDLTASMNKEFITSISRSRSDSSDNDAGSSKDPFRNSMYSETRLKHDAKAAIALRQLWKGREKSNTTGSLDL